MSCHEVKSEIKLSSLLPLHGELICWSHEQATASSRCEMQTHGGLAARSQCEIVSWVKLCGRWVASKWACRESSCKLSDLAVNSNSLLSSVAPSSACCHRVLLCSEAIIEARNKTKRAALATYRSNRHVKLPRIRWIPRRALYPRLFMWSV